MICIDGYGDDGSTGDKALHSFTDSLARSDFQKAISITELPT